MFLNPWEGPESPATFALLVFVILAQSDQYLGGVLGLWPSYRVRDNRATATTRIAQKRWKHTSGEPLLRARQRSSNGREKGPGVRETRHDAQLQCSPDKPRQVTEPSAPHFAHLQNLMVCVP